MRDPRRVKQPRPAWTPLGSQSGLQSKMAKNSALLWVGALTKTSPCCAFRPVCQPSGSRSVRLRSYYRAMGDVFSDARMRELTFLARLEREESVAVTEPKDTAHRRMLIHLLHEGYVNDITRALIPPHYVRIYAGPQNRFAVELDKQAWEEIGGVLGGHTVNLRISHRGSVRRAELEHALKQGRMREPFGVLLDGRYWERDLSIALLSATPQAPLAVMFLDMNGLKTINDTCGHGAGDEAIRTFLQVVKAAIEESGEAYRVGGDEVLTLLPSTAAETAATLARTLLAQLARDTLRDGTITLTASIGVALATDPKERAADVRHRADEVQYKAKEESKKHTPRRSALAVQDMDLVDLL